ncbi:hypothetical protein [Citricoccus sp. I39-566]|uniref:hypothetical protein n=1 Tax=Citricoccus sp. I39-566 TaxID=3073268 RepID=UPI00286D29D4|nr:hypothetical protein [Citricoccus sp. I39-566]WMY78759.1 hypothetical protein RE421_02500 [Citricoccus sp. I39-566]
MQSARLPIPDRNAGLFCLADVVAPEVVPHPGACVAVSWGGLHRAIELLQVDAIWHDWFGESLSQVTGTGAAENLVVHLNQLARASRSDSTNAMTGGKTNG